MGESLGLRFLFVASRGQYSFFQYYRTLIAVCLSIYLSPFEFMLVFLPRGKESSTNNEDLWEK